MRLLASFALLSAGFVSGELSFAYRPGVSYDSSIPTEAAVIGHQPGERISSPSEILTYLKALQRAAPDRMRLVTYGHTWEGRELVYAVIGSPENLKRSGEIQAATQRIADPRKTSAAEANLLSANLPAPVWLAYGVHGNEISSPDAALVTAYHLLAARGDAPTDAVLRNDLILIDPLQNPDGRNRFVQNFNVTEGLEPDSSQLAAEHNEPWPNGRTNHYGFDMNRDWFAMTQPETRGRIAAVRQWMPLVFVDLHEMGSDSSYYFAPEANPYNPYITQTQKDSLEWFGRRNSRDFDALGLSYFTKEGYDEFYPGYGASWPLYYGGIGMTYEQASTRGLVVKKSDGTMVRYGQTVERHFLTSLATLETAAAHRQELWNNFYRYRSEAVAAGAAGKIREYLLVREGDVTNVDKLAAHLADQGVEVRMARSSFQNGGKTFPPGSYSIALNQPSYRLIRALLDTQVSMDPKFLAGEEQRRHARQPSEMYDVTAWSLPLQYGISATAAESESTGGDFIRVGPGQQVTGAVAGTGTVAYLVPWGTSAAGKFLAAALRAGYHVLSSDRVFVQNGRPYPAGTLIIRTKDSGTNRTPSDVAGDIARIAYSSGAEVIGTDTSWMEEGPNFGSRFMQLIPPDLRIAMAWDRPTNVSAAGAIRFELEREFGYPVTVVRTQQLANGDLSQFRVLILPDATSGDAYRAAFGTTGIRRLREWVSNGGTLIAAGPAAVSFLSSGNAGLLATTQEDAAQPEGTKPAREHESSETAAATSHEPVRVPGTILKNSADYLKATQPDNELPDSLHGVLLRAAVDSNSWMSAGVQSTVTAMVTGRTIFTPIKAGQGVNVSYFESFENSLASGYAWQENRKQLAFKPFVLQQRSGRGNVIGFTADPAFRGYMDGLHILLLNAVFRGPAHTLPTLSSESEE